ncbi:MAG: hypothetical protein DI528_09060 [Shinella sp.]|nr:MAG: hypothetical protein DI528_09060 [Shinella sp.]
MNDLKQWYQSKTVWGALIAIAASALRLAGFELTAADQLQLADIAVSAAGTLGGLLAIYGRLKATRGIETRKMNQM